jgi:hypothetical protein
MIIFELGCAQGHHFEGWFASADDFARQAELAMVRCPLCDDEHVAIVPSAKVRVTRHGGAGAPASATRQEATPSPAESVAGLPPELVRKLREAVKATEDVGRRFPDEARRIHYDEVPARAIRGQASHEEAEALRDEGIDFALLPPFLTREPH